MINLSSYTYGEKNMYLQIIVNKFNLDLHAFFWLFEILSEMKPLRLFFKCHKKSLVNKKSQS